jgi:methanogenic corrinoid protein MtbC1
VPDDDLALARLGVRTALREGDVALAYQLLLELMDAGFSMPTILDRVLAPIQRETGQHWEAGETSISEEHASTAAIESLVSILSGALDQPPDADLVVVVCAEGETHSLPARMASAVLAYAGYRTLFLGTSVPGDDLAEHLASTGADVLVVSCTRATNLLGARACVAAGHRVEIPVVVGGRAFVDGTDWWRRIGADTWADSLVSLVDLLQTWEPSPGDAESQVRTVPPSVDTLTAKRLVIAGALVDAIGEHPGEHHRLVSAAAEELVDSAAVAVFLAAPQLLAGEAQWHATLLEHRFGLAVDADDVLSALADAVDATMYGDGRPDDGLIEAARRIVAEQP